MINQILKEKSEKINAVVFVDYENLYKRLKDYQVHPVNDLDFFTVILNDLKDKNLNIIETIAYANFNDINAKIKDQPKIQKFGVETRYTANDGKNSSDIELAVGVLNTLYKKDDIDVFILISSDRDFIPVIKAIKSENKIAYIISTKNGFNEIVKIFADHHEYIEDIFKFQEKGIVLGQKEVIEESIGIEPKQIKEEDMELVNRVCDLLYSSHLWEKYNKNKDNMVGLNGYAEMIISKVLKTNTKEEIIKSFNIAHTLKFVSIVRGEDGLLYLTEGENMEKIIKKVS